jgi:aromatic-L-amino-acid/L-tryptophan decarboxylase
LVSGTSMATLVGLAVARNAQAEGDVRTDGIAGTAQPLVTYASSEVHDSIPKVLELLGLGNKSLHRIPVNRDFSIDLSALKHAIADDRRQGRQPFCVIGCAGTVNTGALDDLEGLSAICRSEGLWLHIDGAFGSLCALNASLRQKVKGIELSDSISFDFHKWMHVQYDAGCVLVRQAGLQERAFSNRPAYLRGYNRGLAGGGEWFCDLGPELSRSFRALKVWFTLKEYGTKQLGEMVEKNCQQAQYLAGLIERTPQLELIAQPTLNIVCFRFIGKGDAKELDNLNGEIVADLQERGIAAPSTTHMHGKLTIRVAITNHRSRQEDFDTLVKAVLDIANERIRIHSTSTDCG